MLMKEHPVVEMDSASEVELIMKQVSITWPCFYHPIESLHCLQARCVVQIAQRDVDMIR